MSKRKPDPRKLAQQRLAERLNQAVAELARAADSAELLEVLLGECLDAAIEPQLALDDLPDDPERARLAAVRLDQLPLTAPDNLRRLWTLARRLRELRELAGEADFQLAAEALLDQAPEAWAAAHAEPGDDDLGEPGEVDE